MQINVDKRVRENRSFRIEKITPEMRVTQFSNIKKKYFSSLEQRVCGSLNQVH